MTLPIAIGLSQARLRDMVVYEPETGVFRWRHRADRLARWNGRYAGKIAGGIYKNGYRYLGIDGVAYRAARLAWLYMTGKEPGPCVDHINGDRANDRWSNLRLATKSENGANRPKQKNNKCGFKGVSLDSRSGRWSARITRQGICFCLGQFDTAEKAADAYDKAALKLFGQFAHVNASSGMDRIKGKAA